MNSNAIKRVLESDAGPLSKVLNLQDGAGAEWQCRDLKAMLRHQLGAPLAFDLGNAAAGKNEVQAQNIALAEAKQLGIKTFLDLLTHPTPPLELLKLVKDLFKKLSGPSPQRRPEQQVDYALYLLAILVARLRCGQSITRLTNSEISQSVQWAVSQEWVDAQTREILAQALAKPICSQEHAPSESGSPPKGR